MSICLRDFYEFATQYLLRRIPTDDPQAVLDCYLGKPDDSDGPKTLEQVYRRLLLSAQNAGMKPTVIGAAVGGFDNLGKVLHDFDPGLVLRDFGGRPEALLEEIRERLNPKGKVRTESRSEWPKYCRAVLSAAKFLAQFEDGGDFYVWAHRLYDDYRSMPALPLIMAQEIEGIGYALACDCLKELGFVNYGKPDVHLMEIFSGVGLCTPKVTPYEVQRVISQIANDARVPAYDVDKVFWLIGSGKFYRHPAFGKDGRLPNWRQLKPEFIEEAKRYQSIP